MNINLLGFGTCIIAVFNIILGFLVFFKNPKRINNITYLFVAFAVSIWSFTTFFYNNPILFDATVWLKIVYTASYLMLVAQMVFVLFFPRRISDNFWIYAFIIFLTIIPSVYVLLFQDSVIVSTTHIAEEFRTLAEMGSGYFVYTIPNVFGIVFLSVYFLRKGRKFVGYEKVQVRLYVLGSLLMIVPIITIDYMIPLLTGYTGLYVYGPLFVLPFTILVAYSILQNRFLDQKIIWSTLFNYVLKSLFFIAFLYLLSTIGLFYSKDLYEPSALFVLVLLIPFVLYLYSKYSSIVEKFTERYILKKKFTTEEIINDFSRKNSTELDLNKICINVRESLVGAIQVSKLGIFLLDTSNSRVLFKYLYNLEMDGVRDLLEILHYWQSLGNDPILIADEVKRKVLFGDEVLDRRMERILRFMDKYRISAVLPLNRKTQLNGVLLIGYKPQEIPLTIDEVDFLENIIANTSVAVGRALLYKQVEDFNKILQQKVNIQTQELQEKVSELQEARRKEADMIDIMGHELRTPATIVKLNAQLLEQIIHKKDLTELNKYVERIKEGVEREIKLINTLLSSAKLEGDKIELSLEEVNISKEIDMALHAHEKEASDKGLQLINNTPKELPSVYGDHARVVEVINNLVSNAVKYTDTGSVTINAHNSEDMIEVSVIDTGNGIPEKDIPMLGKKFYRVQTYIESEDSDDVDIVRPGGTGLGLYVVFSLVKKMGGDIFVQSELGKGSEFTFALPKYVSQDGKEGKSKSNDMFERLGLKRNVPEGVQE